MAETSEDAAIAMLGTAKREAVPAAIRRTRFLFVFKDEVFLGWGTCPVIGGRSAIVF